MFADILADDVDFLLEDAGYDLTLTRLTGSTYNTTTGTMSAGTSANHTIRGVFINYRNENVDGSVIRAGDRLLLVRAAGAPVTPAIGDTVDGVRILDVRTIAPNGVAVAWSCQTRK